MAIGGKRETSQKEIYHLWWEYLKRSIPFKKYCEGMNNKFSPAEKEIIHAAKATLTHLLPPSLIAEAKDPFLPGYLIWGDLHGTSFEEFWKAMEKDKDTIQEAYLQVESFIESYKLFSMVVEKRKPEYNSFIQDLVQYLKDNPNYLFLSVRNISAKSIEELSKEFGAILRKKRESTKKYVQSKASYPWIIPTQPIRFDEVKRYLRIYDRAGLANLGKSEVDLK